MNLFSEQTNNLRLLCSLLDPNIQSDEFEKIKNDIAEIVEDSYKSSDTDIEDLGDIIMIIDDMINKMWIDKDHCRKFYDLIKLRKQTKKLANKKYREGFDYIHENDIKNNIITSKIKNPDEKPREFWNVEECDQQYYELIIYVWKPSVLNLKELMANITK